MRYKYNKPEVNYNTYKDQRGYFCKIYNSLPGKYIARYCTENNKRKLFKEINILENQINRCCYYET